VSDSDLLAVALISAACLVLVALLFRPLLLGSVSAELIEAQGVSSQWVEFAFLAILALATAMALPVVGALLVFSLMVGPACAARSCCSRPGPAVFLSVVFSLVTVWVAIALSYVSDWPVGFFVGAMGAMLYGLGWAWTRAQRPAARVVVRF
jgi:zinc/manganese transport system permease protein